MKKFKLSVFSDGIILYIENSLESEKNTVRANKSIQQHCRTQDQYKNQLYFYMLATNNWKLKIIPFKIHLKC